LSKRCLAEQYIIESAWEAQWLLEYVKSAHLDNRPISFSVIPSKRHSSSALPLSLPKGITAGKRHCQKSESDKDACGALAQAER
jgi:hypothetical protein